ncbi:hypothetical protein MSAN_01203600 [Mycena sanguinolenta]|uniref:Uncharacterized protein n=1 Tax=Mycena sanguinolenta TaxID=230812 RepID=A0A8H7D4N5_9AGAR|nr:hypothetical protein MSAN_01203600 [Mycena sanguinolenta]
MNYTVDAAYLDFGFDAIIYDISHTCTVLVLYAVYVVLFLFSLYTIIHRNSSGRRFMLIISAGLFLFGNHWHGTQEHLSLVWDNLNAAYELRLVTNKSVATACIFLQADSAYRCYMIWGSQKAVLILPGISIVATCVFGYFTVASNNFFTHLPLVDPRVSFAVSGATNVILMCLTVGRIWYMSREARNVNQNALQKRYHTVIAMILESGALYFSVLLLEIGSSSIISQSYAVSVFQAICDGLVEQMVNIIPTLIFVRVGMGYCKWHQESPPGEIRIQVVQTPKRQEEEFPGEDSEVVDIKYTGV